MIFSSVCFRFLNIVYLIFISAAFLAFLAFLCKLFMSIGRMGFCVDVGMYVRARQMYWCVFSGKKIILFEREWMWNMGRSSRGIFRILFIEPKWLDWTVSGHFSINIITLAFVFALVPFRFNENTREQVGWLKRSGRTIRRSTVFVKF